MTQFPGSSEDEYEKFLHEKEEQENGNDSKEKDLKIFYVKLANSDMFFTLH